MKLERLTKEPVLKPNPHHDWERSAVFNCAVVVDRGLIHLIYRATDLPCHQKYGDYVSRLGYAVSRDGLAFWRFDRPLLDPQDGQEQRGLEDPRIVKLDDRFYMMYTGYGGRFPGDYRICLATSRNLIDWERHGVVLDEPNKDASLFPERIGGRYVMLHRRFPDIWLAFSGDMVHWTDHVSILSPIPHTWESARLGIAGPPIKTVHGWLLVYHAADDQNVYRLGAALLDLKDPTRVIARQDGPLLEPELDWECRGWIPNVVFSCGHAEMPDDYYFYYGGADTVIGVAKLAKKDVRFS
ncbi:MAG: glycosidase [Kyrpidia tusciae]|nr:glycosidase [Kyrpidia tusciae]MBE3553180.1 glycosidase [Kyrpidia tusciae]